MKTFAVVTMLSVLIVPRGGTLLEFPIQGVTRGAKADAIKTALEFETWDCLAHPAEDPGKIQTLRCAVCRKPMIRTDAKRQEPADGRERYLKAEVRKDSLRVVSGPWTGIGLLRRSAVAAALRGTGLSLAEDGLQLHGHVMFEVTAKPKAKPEALNKALSVFGTVEGSPAAGPVLLRLARREDPVEHATVADAIRAAGYTLDDTLWIVNQCGGRLVTTAPKRARRSGVDRPVEKPKGRSTSSSN